MTLTRILYIIKFTGDPEAEEILSNIVDYVSRDNDPNDEEQVKSILGRCIFLGISDTARWF